MPSTRRAVMVALVVATVLVLDQVTKAWALRTLPGRVIELVPTVQLRLAYNTGFSFGLGAEYGPLVATGVVIVAIFVGRAALYERVPSRAVMYAMILGGALGNVVDRVLRAGAGVLSGSVVDFIAVTWYAIFNVADMFVVCGALLLVIFEFRRGRTGRDDRI